jgi:hypothetical protein
LRQSDGADISFAPGDENHVLDSSPAGHLIL